VLEVEAIQSPPRAHPWLTAAGLARVAPALLSSVQTFAWVSWPVDGRPSYQVRTRRR